MKTETVDLASLKSPETNPRLHPERQLKEMERSLDMFGQYRPLVVDENRTVLAGNGTHAAMVRLGWKTCTIITIPNLSEKDRNKLMLADNRIADLGSTDFNVVDEILRGMDSDWNIPGFDASVLDELMSTPEELIELSRNYGKITDETIERKESHDRDLDASLEEATVGQAPPPLNPVPTVEGGVAPVAQMENEKGEQVCPTCHRPW